MKQPKKTNNEGKTDRRTKKNKKIRVNMSVYQQLVRKKSLFIMTCV